LRTRKVCCYTFIPCGNEDPFFPAESEGGRAPPSPQPSLHAPEAIEGSVHLRTLRLRPKGSILVEEALTEIPPGQDGFRGQPAEPLARLSFHGHREPVGHDRPIASSRSNIGRVALQEPNGIEGPIITRTDVRPEARRPSRTAKGPGERRESPEADVANLRLANLPNGLQGIEDLTTSLAMTLVDSTEAKTQETIITHVEADLENTPQPPTWRAKYRWISCRKYTGYHTTDPKIQTHGAIRVRSWIATKHNDGSLETSYAQRTAERDRALPRFRALVVR
jgi:hypothetical protein